jgi:uncharacterized protein YqeY
MAGLECYECGRWVGVCQCTLQEKENKMLIEKIKAAQVEARKVRNTVEATLLTTLLGEATMNAQHADPTDEEVAAVIGRFLKRNKEMQDIIQKSIAAQESHNHSYISADILSRLTVAQEEQKILESYLPKIPGLLSESELIQIVNTAIQAGTASTLGALMGYLKANYAGKYDGKVASAAVKTALAA